MDFFNISFWQGVVSSICVVAILAALTRLKDKLIDYARERKLKSLNQELNFVKWEKDHLQQINKSSAALNRSVFADIFWLLLFLSIALGIPTVGLSIAKLHPIFGRIYQFLIPLSASIWAVAIVISIQNIIRFRNLNNYTEAVRRFSKKIETLEKKIEEAAASNNRFKGE